METHKYQTGKFPVGDQVIYHFSKMLLTEVKSDFWIAGGAITSFLSLSKIKDVDCFTKSRQDASKLLRELRNKYDFKHFLITKNAIKGRIQVKGKSILVDVIKNFYQSPMTCIETFDFTVTCFAVDKENFYYHPASAFDLLRKKLVINNLTHPVDTMRRVQKYVKKGFSACNGTILEIAEAVRGLSDEEMEIVEFYPVD